MKKRLLGLGVIGFLFTAALLGALNQAGEDLFQKALRLERNEGKLMEAIEFYNKVVAEKGNEGLSAQAQLRIGMCYEKLGKTEAIKAYELVLEKYSGQKEQVATARARLAELQRGVPKGLSVTDLNFYVPGFSLEPFDLSPDGTKMLGVEFIKGQNIVVCDLETQKVKFITDYDWDKNSSWTYNPIWSPDGKEIAFNANNAGPNGKRLIKSTLDGSSRVLLSNDKYWFFPNAWMPDGSAILTIRGEYKDNTQELGLIPSDGGEFWTLISLQGNVATSGSSRAQACVSPDGRFIAFKNIVSGGKSDIFVISSDGKKSWPLLEHPAEEKLPRWSPDGKHVLFLSLRHGSWALWGVAVKEGRAAGDPFIVQEGATGLSILNWTPNGLACWKWISIQDIFLMDVDPKTGEPVGESKRLEYTPTGENTFPVWSPSGKYLAFLRDDDIDGGSYIVVLDMASGQAQEFRFPGDYYSFNSGVRWMPDSLGIGMICRDFGWKNYILRLNIKTEKWEVIPIPIEGQWFRFEWSGNSKAFIYSKNGHAEKGAGIYEHDLKTGEERLVYSNPQRQVNFRGLKCSRDYKWLAFRESPDSKIMVVNLETGDTHMAASKVGLPSWSPDGQKILAMRTFSAGSEDQQNSMFVLSSSGGSLKEINLSKGLPQKSRIRTQDWSPDGKQVVFDLGQSKSNVLLYKNIISKGKK